MCRIEPLVVLPVAPLYLTIMSGCIRTDQLVADTMFLELYLEQRRTVATPAPVKSFCKLCAIVCLDTLYGCRKRPDEVFKEYGRGISIVFLKSFYEPPAGVFVNSSILVEFLPFCFIHEAGGRDELDIDLDALTGIGHLLVRLCDILGVWRFDSNHTLFAQETVEPWNGAGVAALHKFDPKDDQTGIRVTPTHIRDELDLFRGMLVGMMMRASGKIPEGFDRAVKTAFPAVDILAIGLVLDSSLSDAIFFSVAD